MKKTFLGCLVGILLLFFVARNAFAAFWLQPDDLTLDFVQAQSSNVYMQVSWNAGANVKFYPVSSALGSTEINRILAAALSTQGTGANFKLHINDSGEIDGIRTY